MSTSIDAVLICSIPCLIALRVVIVFAPRRRRKRKRRRKDRVMSHPRRVMVRMPDWHAMLAAEEREPGTWTMAAPDGVEYGTVQIVRVRGEIRYRVMTLGRHVG